MRVCKCEFLTKLDKNWLISAVKAINICQLVQIIRKMTKSLEK